MNSGNPFVNLYAKTDSFLIILKLTLINGVLFFPFCYFFLNEFYYIYNHTIIITNQFYIISFPNHHTLFSFPGLQYTKYTSSL